MKLPKIEKLPSGSYRAQIQINGKRHSITGATPKEVEREIAALKLQLKAAPQKTAELTLSKAIDRYVEERENVLSPATIRGYRTIQRNRFQSLMRRPVKDLTQSVCQSAVNSEAKKCSSKTLSNAWGLLGSVIEDVTGARPKVRIGQVVTKESEFLDSDQINRFVETIKGKRIEIPALLALSSLRASEILALTWDNIDLENGMLQVSGAVVPDEHHKFIEKKENKNATSRRRVPIIEPLSVALNAVVRKEGRVTTYCYNTLLRDVHKACEDAGVPVIGLHGLRHSFASLAYSLGMPEKITMEIGGWSNIQTLQRIYTHIAQKDRSHYESEFTSYFSSES